jgi:hypothetical protein
MFLIIALILLAGALIIGVGYFTFRRFGQFDTVLGTIATDIHALITNSREVNAEIIAAMKANTATIESMHQRMSVIEAVFTSRSVGSNGHGVPTETR